MSPPRVFLDWERPDGSSVKRFYDPVTQASLDIIDLGRARGSLESIKKKTARAHAAESTAGREVLQDQRVRDALYKGWYYEFREGIGGENTHQIWLFAKGRNKVLLLKYSCPTEHFEEFRRSFAESIRSLSPMGTQKVKPTITLPVEREDPPVQLDPAEELLRLLRNDGIDKKFRDR